MSSNIRIIPSYPHYSVSDTGVVYDRFGRPLTQRYLSKYLVVTLSDKNHKRVMKLVHRLVGEAFLGLDPLNPEVEINHKDLCQTNNHVSNLEVVTRLQNMQHRKIEFAKLGRPYFQRKYR